MKELIQTNFFRLLIKYSQEKIPVSDLEVSYLLFEKQLIQLINNQTDFLALYRTLNYTIRELRVLHIKISLEEGKKRICLQNIQLAQLNL